MTNLRLWWIHLSLLSGIAVLAPTASALQRQPLRPIAVLVGSNLAPAGRQQLQYAQSDAKLMAGTLLRSGRFASSDVHVLLEPRPDELLSRLDTVVQQASSENNSNVLLVFYYSGHSDGQRVFPHGEALQLSQLREHIGKSQARLRVAIVDACRGGGWTGSKGLSVGPALKAVDLMNVATEGTALISSSSGIEDAHEAAVYGGSFFTHHVAAGLLGAADADGDGSVTLQEVFDYAKRLTVRDSARLAQSVQHPSFEIDLRGRQDIVLAHIGSEQSSLELRQTHPLQIVHISSGTTILETLPSQRTVRVALPAGHYVIRRVREGTVLSKEIEVRNGEAVTLDESQLVANTLLLATKGAEPAANPTNWRTTLAQGDWELRLGAGTLTGRGKEYGPAGFPEEPVAPEESLKRQLALLVGITYGVTDRLSVGLPAPLFAYRFGEAGGREWIVRGGFPELGYSSISGVLGAVDAGGGSRWWLTPTLSLVSNASATMRFGGQYRRTLRLGVSSGLVWNIARRVQVAFGGRWARGTYLDSESYEQFNKVPARGLELGAISSLGYRPLPLVSLSVLPSLSLDAYASWRLDLDSRDVLDRYLGGITWTF